jgi:hypothetical protein
LAKDASKRRKEAKKVLQDGKQAEDTLNGLMGSFEISGQRAATKKRDKALGGLGINDMDMT